MSTNDLNKNINEESRKLEENPGDYLKTLEKGIEVIKAFTGHPNLTISGASKITGFSRPFTRRVLLTLEKLGYANSNEGRYSLSPKMLSLGYSYIASQNIWEIASPYLEEFSEKIQESSSLATLDNTEIVYVARVSVNKIMKDSLGVGTRLPAHASSVGRVLLAHLSEKKLDRYFQKAELHPYTEKTVTSEVKLREELKEIYEKGWALNSDQLEMGMISMAAPVTDKRGEVVAAVNCATHSGRCNVDKAIEEYLPLLIKTSKSISKKIDFEII